MRRIREVESGFGRALLWIGGFLVATLVVVIPLGILNSNLIWGEANQYGRVPIPGHKVIHLPAGDVGVNVAAALPGRGNETPELLLPTLTLTMKAKGGQEAPSVSEDIGYSTNANDEYVDTQRRVWKLEVPEEGDYLAILQGDFNGHGVNAQAWFGREPSPLHGWTIVLVAMAIVLVVGAIWLAIRALRRRRRPPPPTGFEGTEFGDGPRTAAELEREREGAM
ncbi:MAG TPA: hypothetical protein VMF55_10480 [Solirubrobacterales bacterium]|nr:hypothetical protein [Solirubrobacterales bacterium]